MSFPRYPHYKASGVEWLGEVPGHWEVRPVKNLASIVNGYPFDSKLFDPSEGFPLVRIRDLNKVETETYYRGEFVESAAITSDDVLIGMDGDFNVGRWRGQGRALLNQRMCCVRGKSRLLTRILEYSLPIPLKAINEITYSTTVKHLASSQVEKTFVALPPDVAEQSTIAAFLDRETAKINALVAEYRQLMALLKEKRQAVISHAVTKGLNPDAPMKDSGIEWLGEVPGHWEMTRLGWICSEINDINHVMPVAVENGVPFLSAKDLLDDGTLNFTTDIKMISEDDFATLSKKICPRRGDIIYSRIGACLGKARLVETDTRFLISYSCCVVRVVDERGSRRFIQHLLDGEMILTEARMRTQGIGVPDLGLGEIGRFPVPLPPMSEQESIAAYLDEQSAKFDTLTAEAQRAIDLLQERRTALISAAVTGQIDVCNIPVLTPLENVEAFRGKGKGGAVAELLLDRQADREKETHSGYTVQVS